MVSQSFTRKADEYCVKTMLKPVLLKLKFFSPKYPTKHQQLVSGDMIHITIPYDAN